MSSWVSILEIFLSNIENNTSVIGYDNTIANNVGNGLCLLEIDR